VRLSWPDLFEPAKPMKREDGSVGDGKFGATLLFPVGADLTLLQQAATNLAYQKEPSSYVDGKFYGVHLPFRDQAEKCRKMEGYMPGGIFFRVQSKFQPQVVAPGPLDAEGKLTWPPVTDPRKVYPGVWAICVINAFWFNQGVKKGVSFGLQNVVLIADDQQFGGGGQRDARKDFAGVHVQPGTDFTKMMANAPTGIQPPPSGPMSVMPPATPIAPRPPGPPLPVHALPSVDDDLASVL
jgi:hypothetical protein